MSVTVNWDGDDIKREFSRALAESVAAVTIDTQKEITDTLNRGSSNRGRTPSPPGSPPHRDTGALANSFQLTQKSQHSQDVSSPLVYAAVHEYGNRTHPARPYVRPSVEAVESRKGETIAPFVRDAVRRLM